MCYDFDSLSKVTQLLKLISKKRKHSPNAIFLQPSQPLLLTSDLRVSFVPDTKALHLFGLSGINVYPWPDGFSNKTLVLYYSTVDFYVNNEPSSSYICGTDLIPGSPSTSKNVSFLSAYLSKLWINSGNTYTAQPVCPYLFKNVQLDNIQLDSQVESFLFNILLKFNKQVLAAQLSSKINSTISSLNVTDGYNYKLDTDFLHPLVFEQIKSLKCVGSNAIDLNGPVQAF
jgi:hypothetical protein